MYLLLKLCKAETSDQKPVKPGLSLFSYTFFSLRRSVGRSILAEPPAYNVVSSQHKRKSQ